jgi:menaquinone-dependent protoporphyrinogen IX oxidase
MRQPIPINLTFFLFALTVIPFASGPVNDNCINESAKTRVLIATQNGIFKDSVMRMVIAALSDDSVCVKVLPLGRLTDEVAENYQGIIIGNTVGLFGMSGTAKDFVRKCTDKERKKIVLFTTAFGNKWRPKDLKVDCVTAASEMKDVPDVAGSIINKIRAVLSKK